MKQQSKEAQVQLVTKEYLNSALHEVAEQIALNNLETHECLMDLRKEVAAIEFLVRTLFNKLGVEDKELDKAKAQVLSRLDQLNAEAEEQAKSSLSPEARATLQQIMDKKNGS